MRLDKAGGIVELYSGLTRTKPAAPEILELSSFIHCGGRMLLFWRHKV